LGDRTRLFVLVGWTNADVRSVGDVNDNARNADVATIMTAVTLDRLELDILFLWSEVILWVG